jgi:hypothetical protein
MVFLVRAVKLVPSIRKYRSRKIGCCREAAMKKPRIILWDELPGTIDREPPASWEKSPRAADGYQSEARTGSASCPACGSGRDQAPCEN